MVGIGHSARHSSSGGRYLKSGVYGGIDGIVTTFAVVAGVMGAGLSSGIILILGFANLIADGISMAIGDYISTKSEREYYKKEKNVEEEEAGRHPKSEVKNLEAILEKRGFNKKDAKKLALLISKNKEFEIDTMLCEEIGLTYEKIHPGKNAGVTFLSFALFGLIPLLIFLIGAATNLTIPNSFLWACILSGASMFILGTLKSKITNKNWLVSGAEMLFVGGAAAAAAYFIGELLVKII